MAGVMTQDSIDMIKRDIIASMDQAIRYWQSSVLELTQLGYVTAAAAAQTQLNNMITARNNTITAVQLAPA